MLRWKKFYKGPFLRTLKHGESASAWSNLSVFISYIFGRCLLQTLFNALFEFVCAFALQKLKICSCLGRFQLRYGLNLSKCDLFIHISHLPCILKYALFDIASLDRFQYPGGEGPFSAENSEPTI